jgi:hypothetical protein
VGGSSRPNLSGDGESHYDDAGRYIGRSQPDFFGGGTSHYDEAGRYVGRSQPDFLGDSTTHYDNTGTRTGRSQPDFLGDSTIHYGANPTSWHRSYPVRGHSHSTSRTFTPGLGVVSPSGQRKGGRYATMTRWVVVAMIIGLILVLVLFGDQLEDSFERWLDTNVFGYS